MCSRSIFCPPSFTYLILLLQICAETQSLTFRLSCGRICFVVNLLPQRCCRPSRRIGGTCEGDAATGLALFSLLRDQLTSIRGPSLSRTTLRHTTVRMSSPPPPSPHKYTHVQHRNQHKHIFYTAPFYNSSSQLVTLSLGNLTVVFIPRKPDTGPTPDALLLAPRATERFLRPVKPAGCARGSKIQQIPGQLSGDSYSVNGHTGPKTLQIFENVNYRLKPYQVVFG